MRFIKDDVKFISTLYAAWALCWLTQLPLGGLPSSCYSVSSLFSP